MDVGWNNLGPGSKGQDTMSKEHRKSLPDAFRNRVIEYALLTVLVSLSLLACMAFLRFGTG
jgi:hypothetical protein